MSPTQESRPVRPNEFTRLCKEAKRGFAMLPTERLELLCRLNQAYYGINPETDQGIRRVFALVDQETDQVIVQHDYGDYRSEWLASQHKG